MINTDLFRISDFLFVGCTAVIALIFVNYFGGDILGTKETTVE